jgi:hypothetical protein
MSIQATCPHCDRRGAFADDQAGKRIRCKGCGENFRVPDDEEEDRAERKRRPAERDDRGSDEERPRRQKEKKAGMSPLMLGGLLGGGILLVGGVVLAVIAVVILRPGTVGPRALAVSPTPDPAKVNRTNFFKTHRTMKEEEVIALVGLPQMRGKFAADHLERLQARRQTPLVAATNEGFLKPRLDDPRVEVLYWERGKLSFALFMLEGRVEWVQHLSDDLICQENYDRLQVGMTAAQAREILGPPTVGFNPGANSPKGFDVGFDVWTAPDLKVQVEYEQGKVARKSLNKVP